jgi:hypothetical protein
MRHALLVLFATSLALLLAACGGTRDRTQGSLPSSSELRSQLKEATFATAADFPRVWRHRSQDRLPLREDRRVSR